MGIMAPLVSATVGTVAIMAATIIGMAVIWIPVIPTAVIATITIRIAVAPVVWRTYDN